MPSAHPIQFRQRAVEMASRRDDNGDRLVPIAKLAADLGISESCLRNRVHQDEIATGTRRGTTADERRELVELLRRNRVLEMENEILKRASAYFARENVLPNDLRVHPRRVRGRHRAEGLMRNVGIQGIHRRRGHGCTIRDNTATGFPDRVNRAFQPEHPDRLWCMDITDTPQPPARCISRS